MLSIGHQPTLPPHKLSGIRTASSVFPCSLTSLRRHPRHRCLLFLLLLYLYILSFHCHSYPKRWKQESSDVFSLLLFSLLSPHFSFPILKLQTKNKAIWWLEIRPIHSLTHSLVNSNNTSNSCDFRKSTGRNRRIGAWRIGERYTLRCDVDVWILNRFVLFITCYQWLITTNISSKTETRFI